VAVLQPIRRDRLYQGIVSQIEALLARGELKPGDQLPAERILAEQFEVSRPSVREALRSLELLGIVETRPGGGTFVRQGQPDDLARPLSSIMSRGHSVSDVIDVRGLIEPAVAERAAQNITDVELQELRTVLRAQEQRIQAGEAYVDEDTRFHEVIGQAARNELLVTMLGVVWNVLRASREEWLQTEKRAHTSLRAHRRILAALEAHDPAAARSAAAEHIRAVGEGVLRLIADKEKPAKQEVKK
jgi:GntR family transcriptional repressor for pyruvate dehydrogenase complex